MARKLEGLPLVRAALEGGRIDWSMAEVLARGATAEDEGELLLRVPSETIRSMRALLRARRAERREAARKEEAERAGEGQRKGEREVGLSAPQVLA